MPSFNVPLELGLFLGAQKYEALTTRQKKSLIMDKAKFRYQEFISDLAGIEIASHGGEARLLISIIRNWLSAYSKQHLPGNNMIWKQFRLFNSAVPEITKDLNIKGYELAYTDYIFMMDSWLREHKGM